jgi:hypothetical protein
MYLLEILALIYRNIIL